MSTDSPRKRRRLRARQRLGKYRIEACLADGPFAAVYRAYDTIEGIRVALKVPHPHLTDEHFIEDFRNEVRITARLDHEHTLRVKDASFIDGQFVIVTPLAERTLSDRLTKRLSFRTAMHYAEQMLSAAAHAHAHRVIHCDIKPENLLLFRDDHLRLADFGIAKMSRRTLDASGSGTVGYVAPEQAMGRPSFHSDVFSLGLILYRLFSGHLPAWPYEWPPPGHAKLRARVHPDLVAFIRRALELKPAKRYRDAIQMEEAFLQLKPRAVKFAQRGRKKPANETNGGTRGGWEEVRRKEFQRQFGRALKTHDTCPRCKGPVSEPMRACPWCGASRKKSPERTRFPSQCPRCRRGMKRDWTYCPWCYGAGFEPASMRVYGDKRYVARCANEKCGKKQLMPFMHYCPSCRGAVKRAWPVPGSRDKCPRCGWGVAGVFWNYCPWCTKPIRKS